MNEIEWLEDYIFELRARQNEAIEERKIAEAKYELYKKVERDMKNRLRELKDK